MSIGGDKFSYAPGDIVNVEDDFAETLVKKEIAETYDIEDGQKREDFDAQGKKYRNKLRLKKLEEANKKSPEEVEAERAEAERAEAERAEAERAEAERAEAERAEAEKASKKNKKKDLTL